MAYHLRLPNLCSQKPGDTPALHFFDLVLVQSSYFLCFFRSVPLITGLPPVGRSQLYLEHLNVRPFVVLVSPPRYLFAARIFQLLWLRLTSHLCQLVDDEISLGKVNVLWSNPAESTWLPFWCSWGFTMTWLLTLVTMPHIPFLFVSSDFCRLAYFSAWVTPIHLATC